MATKHLTGEEDGFGIDVHDSVILVLWDVEERGRGVYPGAIDQLSRHYRFKNIGGTSAGAIAAAVTAAAEFQRRCSGSRVGFDLLKSLPQELKAEVRPGQRKLLSLFQPQPATQRLFSVLVHALNSGSTNQRILAMVTGAIRSDWPGAAGRRPGRGLCQTSGSNPYRR